MLTLKLRQGEQEELLIQYLDLKDKNETIIPIDMSKSTTAKTDKGSEYC
ncbi:MAG: hypothetical protein ACJAVI_003049 [Candidatus Azotimanducaceae bacterium]|jgi:hypothetical protein